MTSPPLEGYRLKTRIFKQLDALVSEEALIASNTSSVSITKLASSISHPERVVGLHFFMSLVEIVRGLETSDATHDAAMALAEQLGKAPITVKSAPGFVVNRILLPMINEAFFVLAEGYANAEDIDKGMKLGCNHPIGPLALADMIGLDVLLSVMHVLHDEFADLKYPAMSAAQRAGGCRPSRSQVGPRRVHLLERFWRWSRGENDESRRGTRFREAFEHRGHSRCDPGAGRGFDQGRCERRLSHRPACSRGRLAGKACAAVCPRP